MKVFIIFGSLLAMVLAYYDAKFDNFDAPTVVSNLPILEAVMKCLVNTGPCDDIVVSYKEIIPEIVPTLCAKCSPKQIEIFKIVIGTAMKQYPDLYDAFKKIYDPNNAVGQKLDVYLSRR